MGRRVATGIAVAFAAALVPASAGAATITVNTTNDDFENGGTCSLREAVETANTNLTGFGLGCNGDTAGADTIILQAGQSYPLTLHATPENANQTGDLDISGGGGTTIRSSGAALATIDADSAQFPGGPPDNQRGRAIEVLLNAGPVTLQGIRVQNGAVADGTGGGGIQTFAPLTLIDSEVTNNSIGLFGGVTNFGGGGITVRNPGSLTLTRSTVAGNKVKANAAAPLDSARGGGISFFSGLGSFTATNSTISGNTVDSSGNTDNPTTGGAIDWGGTGQTMTLTNVTISGNSAIGGGGMVITGGLSLGAEGTRLDNTILAGNIGPSEADCSQFDPSYDWTSLGDNIVGNTTGCGVIGGANDLFNQNPLLGVLSNYGGPTRTHILNAGSPAINHGGNCPETDQRGFFRSPAAPCDAGAFELNASPTPPAGPAPPPAAQGVAPVAKKKCRKKKRKRSAVSAKKKCKKKR